MRSTIGVRERSTLCEPESSSLPSLKYRRRILNGNVKRLSATRKRRSPGPFPTTRPIVDWSCRIPGGCWYARPNRHRKKTRLYWSDKKLTMLRLQNSTWEFYWPVTKTSVAESLEPRKFRPLFVGVSGGTL